MAGEPYEEEDDESRPGEGIAGFARGQAAHDPGQAGDGEREDETDGGACPRLGL
jgi:hypothetical protein